MGIVTTIFLVCALRTNAVFMMVFVTLATGWYTLAASYWARAQGDADRGQRLEVVRIYNILGHRGFSFSATPSYCSAQLTH